MIDRFTRMLAGLLGRSARLLPAARRDWAEAVLAEAGEIPAGAGRVAWLGGGLWLVAREVVMGRVVRVLAFAVAAAGMVWIGWPGASSNSATPSEPGVRRRYGSAAGRAAVGGPPLFRAGRSGWAPRAARAGGYAMVLALIAAKAVKDRDGSKLGAYFAVVPGIWVMGDLAAAGHRRLRGGAAHPDLPARAAHPLDPAGRDRVRRGHRQCAVRARALRRKGRPQRPVTEMVGAGRTGATPGDRVPGGAIVRPGHVADGLGPTGKGALAASCATATAALLLAVLTSVTIALYPHHVPLEGTPRRRRARRRVHRRGRL